MDGLITMLEFHRHSNAQIMCPLITIYIPDYVTFDSLTSSYLDVVRTCINRVFDRVPICWGSGMWKSQDGMWGNLYYNNTKFTIEKNDGSYRFAFKGVELALTLIDGKLVLWSEVLPPPRYYRRFNVSFIR